MLQRVSRGLPVSSSQAPRRVTAVKRPHPLSRLEGHPGVSTDPLLRDTLGALIRGERAYDVAPLVTITVTGRQKVLERTLAHLRIVLQAATKGPLLEVIEDLCRLVQTLRPGHREVYRTASALRRIFSHEEAAIRAAALSAYEEVSQLFCLGAPETLREMKALADLADTDDTSLRMTALWARSARSRQIWADWAKAQNKIVWAPHRPGTEEVQTVGAMIERLLLQVPDGVQCLIAHASFLDYAAWYVGLPELLRRHPSLDEIRLCLPDNQVLWVAKGGAAGEDRDHLSLLCHDVEPPHPWLSGDDHAAPDVYHADLRLDWEPPQGLPPIHQHLKSLRTAQGLTIGQVAQALLDDQRIQATLVTKSSQGCLRNMEDRVRRYERAPAEVPFLYLQALALLYGADVRDLIAVSNWTRYPGIPQEAWQGPFHPIYIYNHSDRDRMSYYLQETTKGIASFGWWIWYFASDPAQYCQNLADAAAHFGFMEDTIADWVYNRRPPGQRSLAALSQGLCVSEDWLTERAEATFRAELPTRRLYPGRMPLLDHRGDPEKLAIYAASPGHPAQYFFGARKLHPDSPTVTGLSTRLGHSPDYVIGFESARVSLEPGNLNSWIEFYRAVGLPERLLRTALEEQGVMAGDSPIYYVAEAAVGMHLKDLAARAGFKRGVLTKLLHGQATTSIETIASLSRAFPDFRGAAYFCETNPWIADFFPEAAAGHLLLSWSDIDEALKRIHVGEAMFRVRMEPPQRDDMRYRPDGTLALAELERQTGIKGNLYPVYESLFIRIANPEVIKNLSKLLNVSRRILCLHYFPELLLIFKSVDPHTGTELRINSGDYDYWWARTNQRRNRDNLRSELRRLLRDELSPGQDEARGRHAEQEKLAACLGMTPKEAAKFLKGSTYLKLANITLLAAQMPGIDYLRWHEHHRRHALAFFMGTQAGTFAIDDQIPMGLSLTGLADFDMVRYVKDCAATAQRDRMQEVQWNSVKYLLKKQGQQWTDNFIVRLARLTGADRRLMWMWARQDELRPRLERSGV